MAEFTGAVKLLCRLCAAQEDCEECPIGKTIDYVCPIGDIVMEDAEKIERVVMDWAKENPEPVYPSWKEAWKSLFPGMAEENPPCPRYFISSARLGEFCPGMRCETCYNQPMFADIAEKLGIKPIGGKDDEKA